jgi:GDP-4-dehydro-6-deoxy-D-mannose reductase
VSALSTALITGATGFIGGSVARALHSAGNVRVVGTSFRRPGYGVHEWATLDIRLASQVESVVRHFQPDMVFHFAGDRPASNESDSVITAGAENLLVSLQRWAPKATVVIVGSVAEYGPLPPASLPATENSPCHPETAYGRAKLVATQFALDFARRFGMRVMVARLANVIGPGIPATYVVGAILRRIREACVSGAGAIVVGNIEVRRDFVALDDVVVAVLALANRAAPGHVFNISSGVATRVGDLIEQLIALSPGPLQLRTDPALIRDEAAIFYASSEKLQTTLGIVPRVDLRETLRSCWLHEFARMQCV